MNGTGKNTISGIKGVIDMNVKVFKSNDKSVNQTYILVEGVVSGIDIVESAAYDATLDQLASLKDQVKQLEDDKKVLQDENNKMREQMQEATKNVMEVSLKLVNEAELNKQLAKSKAETNEKMREELFNTQKELTDEKVNSSEYRGQIKGLKERVDSLEKQLTEERIKVEAYMYLIGNLTQLRRSNYVLGYADAKWGYGTSEDFQKIYEKMIKYAKKYNEDYKKAVESLVSLSEDVCLIEKK